LIHILFVCTGNICRSPLAEGILREKLESYDIPAVVDSCGFESFHIGDPPDHRAQQVARKYGIDIASHRARLFKVADFERFDRIYAMDSSHYHRLMGLANTDTARGKVDYILNVLYPGQNRPVEDPWYHGMEAFEQVFNQLDRACERICEELLPGPKRK